MFGMSLDAIGMGLCFNIYFFGEIFQVGTYFTHVHDVICTEYLAASITKDLAGKRML